MRFSASEVESKLVLNVEVLMRIKAHTLKKMFAKFKDTLNSRNTAFDINLRRWALLAKYEINYPLFRFILILN